MFDINKALKEIDDSIVTCLYESFEDIFTDLKLTTIKIKDYKTPNTHKYTNKMLLNDYLFLKVKEYYYSRLFTNLVFLYDFKYALQIKNVAKSIAPVLFDIYEKKYNHTLSPTKNMETTSIDKITKNNKQKSVEMLFNYQELTKKLNKLHEYLKSNDNISDPFWSSNPAVLFQSIINKSFSYDFYEYNIPFKYLLATNDCKKLPEDFTEYIVLNLILFYGDRNKISSSKNIINKTTNILKSLNSKKRTSEYNDLREIIDEKYNEAIKKINLVRYTMDNNSYKHDTYYYLFNSYFHNHFFSSYNHPFLKLISKRISIQELYNVTKDILNKNNLKMQPNPYDSSLLNYSIDESYYYLELMCLLLEFDIDFNNVDENQFYCILDELFFSAKENKYVFLKGFENNKTIFKISSEKKKAVEAQIDFIYNFLNKVKPDNNGFLDVFHLKHVEELFDYIQEDISKEQFLDIIKVIQKELNQLYSNIGIPCFNPIDLTNDDFIYDRFYLTTYLLKYSFIKNLK